MAEETFPNPNEEAQKQPSSIEKCISVLQAARSDTERFAALLLITQLVRSDSVDSSGRRKLFDAVGFSFINRLLNTTCVPNDCSKDIYRSLAITILACFSTDEDLLFHPQMVAKVPFLVECIENTEENAIYIEDCYQILLLLASTSKGCKVLLEKETAGALCRVVGKRPSRADTAVNILLQIQHFYAKELWETNEDGLIEVLNALSVRFKEMQDSSKFQLCKVLTSFLGTAKPTVIERSYQGQWLKDIYYGLKDILQSKVTSEQRDPALVLVSEVCEHVGMKWMIDCADRDSQGLFILCITLAAVETRMILDGKTPEEVNLQSNLLSSCYNILEKAIGFVLENASNPNSQENDISLPAAIQSSLPSVYGLVTDAMQAVIRYLQSISNLQVVTMMAEEERQVILASVRVLCAWMAEETAALQDDICLLLPFLIKLATELMSYPTDIQPACSIETKPTGKAKSVSFVIERSADGTARKRCHTDFNMLRFLLPPLCHLSADEKPRKILIKNKGHELLLKYLFLQWKTWKASKEASADQQDAKSSLVILLGIFLNIAVTEPQLASSDEVFKELGLHAINHIPELVASGKDVILLANLVVLGLMVIKHYPEKESLRSMPSFVPFLTAAVCFLKEAKSILPSSEQSQSSKLAQASKDVWLDIADLWFLGTQVVISLIGVFPLLRNILKESGWIEEIVRCASDSRQRDDLANDEKETFFSLLRRVQDF